MQRGPGAFGSAKAHLSPPELGEWLAVRVMEDDESARVFLLVDDEGRILSHRRADDYDEEGRDCDDQPLVILLPDQGMAAYLKVGPSCSLADARGKTLEKLRIPPNVTSR